MKRLAATLAASVLTVATLQGASPSSPPHRLSGSFPVGGAGGWDYVTVDDAARRIFVAHATRVVVLDADSGRVVGEIPGTDGVHGIALAPGLKKGFTSNGRAGTVTVFDPGSLAITATIESTGENPDAILYEPVTKRVFAFNGRGNNATAIDAAAGTVAGTVPLGGKPEFAASDPSGVVYVNIENTAEIVAFEAVSLAIKGRWSLRPCEDPTGLAIDPKSRRLFAGCGNRLLAVVSAETGKVLGTVPIGAGCDAVVFEPGTDLVYASAGDGTLTVVRETAPGAWSAVETVETSRGARTMALDPKTGRIFLPTARYGPVPAPSAENPRPRPSILPDSFEILVVSRR